MNEEWSQKTKDMGALLNKEVTYKEGIEKLLELRTELFTQIEQIVNGYPDKAFSLMPFPNVTGYHSKTLSYSIWHIFRIEDIVAHELIAENEQIFFAGKWQEAIHSPIITTGNELKGEAIREFSEKLDVQTLLNYAKAVMEATNEILRNLTYADLKRRFGEEEKEKLRRIDCVSTDKDAVWLIDYWCGKDVRGLLKMPFSRHWIMHIEAMQRIKNKLCKQCKQ